tara:strand:- start:84 stop:452 length:369 start_codon:yes stop_codon:yes gene_type:complete
MVDKREYLQNLKMIDLKELAKLNNVIGVSQHRKNKLVNLMVDCDLGKLEEKFKIPIEQEIFEYTMKAAELEVACCHGSDDPLCKECTEDEEPIILHLPNIVAEKSVSWEKAYNKGLQILQKK